jgi:hypothetical protein
MLESIELLYLEDRVMASAEDGTQKLELLNVLKVC